MHAEIQKYYIKGIKNVRIERPQSRSPFFNKVDFELVQSQVIFVSVCVVVVRM